MKTFYDLPDIEPVELIIELDSISDMGAPWAKVAYNGRQLYNTVVAGHARIRTKIPLLDPINLSIEMSRKVYSEQRETALLIKSIQVDGNELMPNYCHLANYENDHQINTPTTYLGFNGTWNFSIDRPFYQWLHTATGQGWLLSP
jgi:hypothetical protein